MIEIFQYDFMINALIASLLASIACGIVGTYIVIKRIVFISGGISHTAYGGIGLGFFLGFNPLLGALAFGLGAATFISLLRRSKKQNEDMLIGMMWALGMGLGIIFTNLTPGYAPNLSSFLFGNILMINNSDLIIIASLDFLILFIVLKFFKEFRAITFDEEYARTLGLHVNWLYFLLLSIIALTTVVLIKIAGIILIIALLTIPASISIKFSKSLSRMMFFATMLGVFFTAGGLIISYYCNLTSGATIIILAVCVYLIFTIFFSFANWKTRKKLRGNN